jgi:Anti-sigma-K factor rskA, C-terminal/Putative zinc-finger
VDTPMSHSEFEELAAGYVLGALEPDDEHDFQEHLGGCATCEASVRELEAVVGELAYAAPPVDPPDTVWAGIRRQIEPQAARRGATPGAAPRRRAGRRLLPGLAAAAAILLVVALSAWNLSLRDDNAAIRGVLAALERATQLANDPNASLVTMDEIPGPQGAQATVIASSRQDRGVLLIESLPPLARDRVYELWGVPQGEIAKAQRALTFVPLRRPGVQALEFEVPIQPGTAFAITDEPGPDGSEKPTTQPLLVGAPPTA